MLGVYVRPFGDRVWSGGLVVLLGELGLLRGRGAHRPDPAGPPRPDRARARRAPGPLPPHRRAPTACWPRATGGSSRSATPATTTAPGPCSGTRSPRTAGWSAAAWPAGCASSASARCRTDCGSRPTTIPRRSQRLLAELDVADHVTLFAAQPDTVVGLPALISRAWNLSGLVDRYESFTAEFAPLRRRRRDRRAQRRRGVSDPDPARAPVPRLPDDRPRAARGRGSGVGPASAGGRDVPRALRGPRAGLAAALRAVTAAYAEAG